jgi:hypothetical protein
VIKIFSIFDLEYLIRVQSSELLHAKMNPTSCLFGSRFACEPQTAIFSTEPCSKNAGETSKLSNQNRAALWQIFSSNESAPANRKTGFYANRDPNKQEVGFIFAVSSTELRSPFNIHECN